MSTPTSPLTVRLYAVLRIVVGFLFLCHGLQKVFGLLTEDPAKAVGTQLWFGGLIELVCGLAVLLGLFTQVAAFLASGTMAVAYFQFHWKMGEASFFPAVNRGELAVVYCFLFLYMAVRGSGPWSLDARRKRLR